jgi:hypothetical protein
MSALEFAAVIVCDDVRKEANNKEILIGVYTGDIIVRKVPAWLPIAFWIETQAKQIGHHDLSFRLVVLDNEPPIPIKLGVKTDAIGPFSITIVGIQLLLEKEGNISLEVKEGETWRVLKSKRVIVGEVQGGYPIPVRQAGNLQKTDNA